MDQSYEAARPFIGTYQSRTLGCIEYVHRALSDRQSNVALGTIA
jgi:hypothetical protein